MTPSIKPWKELTFTDDYMFKKTMEARRVCKGILNRVLPWNVRRITYFEKEKEFDLRRKPVDLPIPAHLRGKSLARPSR
ncbi:hypothetical protein [uncultured Selenomonas sp.]|uniref:hypothetical protein n=1 Tax=uncultured Selenomonas sp. TaxID=159275 RepID=UPI0025D431F0|nr:hypothetical protein [uncultured Selenomonas sp.]